MDELIKRQDALDEAEAQVNIFDFMEGTDDS